MNYKILGDTDCSMVDISLSNNESIKIERGSMVYMKDINLNAKLNSEKSGIGGLFSAIGRGLTSGESMFITHAIGTSNNARIGIAPASPGKIKTLEVAGPRQYRLNTGAFLACENSVNYVMKSQGVSKAFFGGTGGFFVMETEGVGKILVSAFGDLLPIEINSNNPIIIDNEHVVAWDSSLDYKIEIASGTFGFMSGEGLVNKFSGNGTVLIQTRNIHSLASIIDPFITKTN
ncbi:MAG: TIGR00266 family protein [Clostridiales bacterium]|nr:MAG: TIGR00266 family protein [Clostridiales bacterium]